MIPRKRPIDFTDLEVRALLAGRKAVARRATEAGCAPLFNRQWVNERRFGGPGDLLYVREAHAMSPVIYRATYEGPHRDWGSWSLARDMPRGSSRITLQVIDARIERLHEITEQDARMEGLSPSLDTNRFRDAFARTWDVTNFNLPERLKWAANPWVWRVAFRRLS